uniref:Copper type II ascorbate-dependent monooxygenase C-terminal domain-containing protein n=1 Tax=Castor canadensis TaxID=51338 RepID=A0A8C0WFY6_CASCN
KSLQYIRLFFKIYISTFSYLRYICVFSDNHKDCSGVSLHLTRLPQPLIAGMYLMMSVDTVIPAGEKVVNSDISCHYKTYPMNVFAYRVHTHHLGKVVSGYRVRNGQWTMIGRQSPQLPQAFYPVEHPVDVSFGDILAARCVFTGEGRTEATHIGGTSSDEMCNLYIMYYMEAKHAVSFMTCTQNVAPDTFRTIPPEASIPIPVKSDVVMMHGHHKETENKDKTALLQQPKREEEEVLDQGDFYSLLSKLLGEREDVVHVHKYNPTEKAESESDLVAEIANVVQKKDLGRSDARQGAESGERGNAILVRDRIHKFHRLESTLRPAESRVLSLQHPGEGAWEPEHTGDFHVEEALDWPGVYLLPSQVSGVALDPNNNLVIFHRGDHVWDGNSFDSKFVYQQRGLGPIEEDTILVVDPNSAAILQSSGKSLFYLPHGLSVDKDGNYWLTDVALHQVFKLDPNSKEGPLLILGRSMQPGSDQNHFCQPTDVAVDPDTGAIYVSDGYCNSRIVQFSPNGNFLTQWGEESSRSGPKPGQFSVPHSLALVPHLGQLCVADRENGRIQCFKTDTKEFVKEIKHASFGRNVFAISYIPGLLFAVNGKPYFGDQEPVQGFVMNFSNGEIIDVFKPVRKHFDMPHDIVASEDGTVYIGDVHTNTVWKFTLTEKFTRKWRLICTNLTSILHYCFLLPPGKGSGGLNLGNFFASHKGYSRKGFDRLSTEGSDQEKDEDDGSESEEEYSAPLPTQAPSS